uniref:Uncharacterized protein n=1 Tax=Helianthus annuus TaxID=4232 RepID=A0A251VH21_HELAN
MAQRREAGEQLAFPPSSTKNLLDLLDLLYSTTFQPTDRSHMVSSAVLCSCFFSNLIAVCPPQLIVSLKYTVVASPATSAAARSTTRSHQINTTMRWDR